MIPVIKKTTFFYSPPKGKIDCFTAPLRKYLVSVQHFLNENEWDVEALRRVLRHGHEKISIENRECHSEFSRKDAHLLWSRTLILLQYRKRVRLGYTRTPPPTIGFFHRAECVELAPFGTLQFVRRRGAWWSVGDRGEIPSSMVIGWGSPLLSPSYLRWDACDESLEFDQEFGDVRWIAEKRLLQSPFWTIEVDPRGICEVVEYRGEFGNFSISRA